MSEELETVRKRLKEQRLLWDRIRILQPFELKKITCSIIDQLTKIANVKEAEQLQQGFQKALQMGPGAMKECLFYMFYQDFQELNSLQILNKIADVPSLSSMLMNENGVLVSIYERTASDLKRLNEKKIKDLLSNQATIDRAKNLKKVEQINALYLTREKALQQIFTALDERCPIDVYYQQYQAHFLEACALRASITKTRQQLQQLDQDPKKKRKPLTTYWKKRQLLVKKRQSEQLWQEKREQVALEAKSFLARQLTTLVNIINEQNDLEKPIAAKYLGLHYDVRHDEVKAILDITFDQEEKMSVGKQFATMENRPYDAKTLLRFDGWYQVTPERFLKLQVKNMHTTALNRNVQECTKELEPVLNVQAKLPEVDDNVKTLTNINQVLASLLNTSISPIVAHLTQQQREQLLKECQATPNLKEVVQETNLESRVLKKVQQYRAKNAS